MRRTWTGSFTRAFENWPESLRVLLISICATACAPSDADFGIHIADLRAQRVAGGIEVRARHEVNLSREARTALQHGVPLRLRIDLAVRGPGRRSAADDSAFIYEIRYLPLSDVYQLSGPGADGPVRTYPRLRHVLAALDELELQLSGTSGERGPVSLKMRSRLDRSGMPGPMQLPVLLSPQWKHDSGWVSGELQFSG